SVESSETTSIISRRSPSEISQEYLFPSLLESTLITIEHAFEIASQIFQPQYYDRIPSKFKLLFRNRGGFDRKVFFDKCRNINDTIILLKVEGTGEILGGYNPLT
ncbi:2048_t:CDS:1, partial [Racocetra persica]